MTRCQGIREEAKKTSKYYIAQLIKVDKQMTRSRTRRDEQLAATTRQHAQMRVDFLRERERNESTVFSSNIATNRIPDLQVTDEHAILTAISFSHRYTQTPDGAPQIASVVGVEARSGMVWYGMIFAA